MKANLFIFAACVLSTLALLLIMPATLAAKLSERLMAIASAFEIESLRARAMAKVKSRTLP